MFRKYVKGFVGYLRKSKASLENTKHLFGRASEFSVRIPIEKDVHQLQTYLSLLTGPIATNYLIYRIKNLTGMLTEHPLSSNMLSYEGRDPKEFIANHSIRKLGRKDSFS